MKMDALFPMIRKIEFPQSVTEALKIVHIQCEKMSKNSVSISQELNQITDFVDDYVFGHPRTKIKKLGSIQQMQIIQALIDYFSSDTDFSLLCSVFMVVFLAKGRQVDFKISTLSKLLSLNLGQGHKTLLNCAALWWTQQPPNSEHCKAVTRSLVEDYIILLPDCESSLESTPHQSPLLAGILLTFFSDLYALPDSSRAFQPPPAQLVELAGSWLQGNPDLCGGPGQSETQGVVTMLGRSPVSGLLVWTILSPLFCEREGQPAYSKLHFTLLQHITEENGEYSVPGGFMSNLTETLLSIFNTATFSDQQLNHCLDRFGQALQAVRASKCRIEEDLLLLIGQLPYNRLINIIISNIS